MHMIFFYGLATGKFARGSGDPLGGQPDFSETQESETIVLDGPDKPADANVDLRAAAATAGGKRKRGVTCLERLYISDVPCSYYIICHMFNMHFIAFIYVF